MAKEEEVTVDGNPKEKMKENKERTKRMRRENEEKRGKGNEKMRWNKQGEGDLVDNV